MSPTKAFGIMLLAMLLTHGEPSILDAIVSSVMPVADCK